jgi:hypothetical protein
MQLLLPMLLAKACSKVIFDAAWNIFPIADGGGWNGSIDHTKTKREYHIY